MKNLILIGTLLTLINSGISLGEETKKDEAAPGQTKPLMTAKMRQQMATIHEKMAACLRSDKTVRDCRMEMKNNCQEMMGKEGCPMLGMQQKMHHGSAHQSG